MNSTAAVTGKSSGEKEEKRKDEKNRHFRGFVPRTVTAAALLCCILLTCATAGERKIAPPRLDGYSRLRVYYLEPDDDIGDYTRGITFRFSQSGAEYLLQSDYYHGYLGSSGEGE